MNIKGIVILVMLDVRHSARIVYSEKLGLHMLNEQTDIGPILGSTSCRYKLPLTYPDTISVGAKIMGLADDRFTMKYVVVSHRHQKIAAEGDGVMVMYNYTEAKRPLSLRRSGRRFLPGTGCV